MKRCAHLALFIAVLAMVAGCGLSRHVERDLDSSKHDFKVAFLRGAPAMCNNFGKCLYYNLERPYQDVLFEARAELLPDGWIESSSPHGVSFDKPSGLNEPARVNVLRGQHFLDMGVAVLEPGGGTAVQVLQSSIMPKLLVKP